MSTPLGRNSDAIIRECRTGDIDHRADLDIEDSTLSVKVAVDDPDREGADLADRARHRGGYHQGGKEGGESEHDGRGSLRWLNSKD